VDRLLDGLTEDQRLAVTVDAARLRILAGAGSGKTRVLTSRIAHLAQAGSLEPSHTLALTFTRKAAGELRSRLHRLGLQSEISAGTFHAQAYAQLRTRWAEQGVRAPALLERRGRLLYRILPKGIEGPGRADVQTEIDWATARRIPPDLYPAAAERAGRRTSVAPGQVGEYFRRFVEEKRRRKLVDFDDLMELTIQSMGDPTYAQARHWRYRYLFVDEFQDVTPLQYQLLRAWLGNDSTICAVGDPNQAIYSWNGADAAYLIDFDYHFPGGQSVELATNFRSTPQILAAAEAVLGRRSRLNAVRADGRPPTVRALEDGAEEALGIARKVRDCHRPSGLWAHQAVLVRTNAQTTVIADALRTAGIPVAIRDGSTLLDEASVAARLTQLENDSRPLRSLMVDLRIETQAASLDDSAPTIGDLAPDHAAALLALAADQLAIDADASVADFIIWIRATMRGERSEGASDAVEIVTFHASKGLEWPVVHLAGLEEGLVPISYAVTPEAVAEERRLVYVAMTRAQDQLHCSWARSRRFGERSRDRQPSTFLSDMALVADPNSPTVAADNLARVRAVRDRLGVRDVADEPEEDLRERVRAWRATTARAAAVPAYVVFTDRTLDALVEQRPHDREALANIAGVGPVKLERYGNALLELLA